MEHPPIEGHFWFSAQQQAHYERVSRFPLEGPAPRRATYCEVDGKTHRYTEMSIDPDYKPRYADSKYLGCGKWVREPGA